jgi:hypothetical protein
MNLRGKMSALTMLANQVRTLAFPVGESSLSTFSSSK